MVERQLSFDRASHTVDAIQRAAYRLSDRLSVELAVEADVLRCAVAVPTDDDALADGVIHDFKNEVLDQVLRERIRDETAGTRNLILALAFSKTTLASGN